MNYKIFPKKVSVEGKPLESYENTFFLNDVYFEKKICCGRGACSNKKQLKQRCND